MRSGAEQNGRPRSDLGAVYEIQVEGELDQSWEPWLEGLTIKAGSTGRFRFHAANPGCTALTGAVADQAALRGLLCRLWDLNLTIVSVRRIEGEEQDG